MAKPIWNGNISFGLVNIPVKLFTALARKELHFHQLHDVDGVRIVQKRVCPADGDEVPIDHLVKGYELSKDRYVIITPEELEALDPKASRTIEISEFIDLAAVDPIYFDHPYYLVPESGSAKAYRLLHQAMRQTGKAALARVVIRNKQYLVLIRSLKKALTMTTMLYGDEIVPVRDMGDFFDDEVEIGGDELVLAKQIVTSKTTEFDLNKYSDEHRRLVMDLIDRKSTGEAVVTQPPVKEEAGAQVIDLMAALEDSLRAIKEEREGRSKVSEKRDQV